MVNKIKIQYGLEDLKSRIPSLFPYLEYDENNVCHIHCATDNEEGCYGKIPASILIPEGISLIIDGTVLIDGGQTYSYRTIMNYYYKYESYESDFKDFISRGIGRFSISDVILRKFAKDSGDKGLIDLSMRFDEFDLIPEFGYLSECERLYNEYYDEKITIDRYLKWKDIGGEKNCEMECFIEKFHRKGDILLMKFYESKLKQAVEIANEYLEYAAVEETCYSIDFLITSKENDLGLFNSYPEEYDINNDTKYSKEWIGDIKIEGITDSRLSQFRDGIDYINVDCSQQYPTNNEDWLIFYKKGFISHYETETDSFGNICIKDGEERITDKGSIETNLMAYGNILNDITYDKDNNTIRFEYIIGANFKAELSDIGEDDDGNKLYYYKSFLYNEDDKHGVKYIEEYHYDDGSQISEIIDKGLFEIYVKDTSLLTTDEKKQLSYINRKFNISYKYFKCQFRTSDKSVISSANINGDYYHYSYIPSEYEVISDGGYVIIDENDSIIAFKKNDDSINPLFRYDHLVGVQYKPEVSVDVAINRGNASAFERHIKLGEVKSYDDIENYANGGFFIIS